MRSTLIICGLLCVFLAVSPQAEAGPADRGHAKQHFDDAERQYRLGRFEQALAEYAKAYELLPEPAFLFNIGQCHRNLGNYERAVFFYRTYLSELKKPEERARVEALIAELEAKPNAQRPEATRLEDGAVETPARGETASMSSLPEVQRDLAVQPADARLSQTEDGGMPIWPWIVAGVVLAIAGGTAVAFATANSGEDDLDRGLLLDFRDR
jgi:tetratricopeptide (TPR) repeat protein